MPRQLDFNNDPICNDFTVEGKIEELTKYLSPKDSADVHGRFNLLGLGLTETQKTRILTKVGQELDRWNNMPDDYWVGKSRKDARNLIGNACAQFTDALIAEAQKENGLPDGFSGESFEELVEFMAFIRRLR